MFLQSVLFVTFLSFTESANILACIPMPSHSHQVAFFDLWAQLSLRGHNITVITTDPLRDPELKNLTEIDVSQSYAYLKGFSKVCEDEMNPWNYEAMERKVLLDIKYYQFSHPEIQDLIRGKGKFDVVLVQHMFPEFLLFGKIYNCPIILISSNEVHQIYHDVLGNPSHPVSHPDIHLPYYGSMSFFDRLWSTMYYCYVWYEYHFRSVAYYEENLRKYFNTTIKIKELLTNVNMIFLYSHPVIHGSRALSPGTVLVSYHRIPRKQQGLERSVKEFMDNAKEGFIYFSLGTNVKSSQLNKNLLETIIETLRELPYKVLYKYETDMPKKPDNVKIVKWAPQMKILNHPNIKLFITQGGRQSTEEAIYASVPMVILPFFYDQHQTALMMQFRGIAQVVQRRPYLKKEEFIRAIHEVTTNPRYKKAVKRLRKLALDFPMNGLEKAIWWTEYVIRNNGANPLRNPIADLPLYQFFLLDVMGFLVLVSVAVLLVIYVVVKKIAIKCCHSLRKVEKLE